MAIITGKGSIEAIYGLMGWKGLRFILREACLRFFSKVLVFLISCQKLGNLLHILDTPNSTFN